MEPGNDREEAPTVTERPPAGEGAETRKEKQRERARGTAAPPSPQDWAPRAPRRPPPRTAGVSPERGQSAQATRQSSMATSSLGGSRAQSPPAKTPGAPGRPLTVSTRTGRRAALRRQKPLLAGLWPLAAPHPAACPAHSLAQHRAQGCRHHPARVPGSGKKAELSACITDGPVHGDANTGIPEQGRWPCDGGAPRAPSPADGPLLHTRPAQGCALRHPDR